MNSLEEVSKIKRENLDEKNYFKTLIEEAYINQMITDDDMVNMQIEIIYLLDEKLYKYNGLNSSSIRKEIVEEINLSNYYTIGLYLKTFKNPDEALKEIKEKGVKAAYYNDTIIGGIQGFLKIYNPDFNAQDMKITADYPLYNNLIGKIEGIEFIKEYINSIYLENEFCNIFSNEKIEILLYSYSSEYKDLIINIFEIVFLEVIACKLVKKNIYDLGINSKELNEIYKLFKGKNKIEIEQIIKDAYRKICKELIEEKKELQEYIEKNLSGIVNIIENAVKQNTLDKVFIIQDFIDNYLKL